jgi:hypothetical protein
MECGMWFEVSQTQTHDAMKHENFIIFSRGKIKEKVHVNDTKTTRKFTPFTGLTGVMVESQEGIAEAEKKNTPRCP